MLKVLKVAFSSLREIEKLVGKGGGSVSKLIQI